jgi:hypothetical protein
MRGLIAAFGLVPNKNGENRKRNKISSPLLSN